MEGIKVTLKDNLGQQISLILKDGKNIFGRKSVGQIVEEVNFSLEINDAEMSRKHCSINLETNFSGETVLTLNDENSANGTYLLGFREEPIDQFDIIYLKHNDEIKIGKTVFQIIVPNNITLAQANIIEKSDQNVKTAIWKK